MKRLVLETTAPFQGLPELVAYDEGLFAKEGLAVEWADREKGVEKKIDTSVTSPKGVDPFASHGRLLEQGQADMYNACEWGNYCRVQETSHGSRQVGRRAIVSYAAMVVAPDSPIDFALPSSRHHRRKKSCATRRRCDPASVPRRCVVDRSDRYQFGRGPAAGPCLGRILRSGRDLRSREVL